MGRSRCCIRVLCLAAVLAAPGALADDAARLDADAARRAYRLSAELMSPYCPGRTLADCPSPDAAALRHELRGLLDQGIDEGEIRSRLEARFGTGISGIPSGAARWLPAVGLAAGAGALALALRSLSRRRATPDDPLPPPDPGLEAELDAALGRERDGG